MSCLRFIVLSVLFVSTVAHAAATVSLKAVARNGAPIAPTNHLNVDPGDVVIAEIYLSGWSTPPFDPPTNSGLVQTYQVTLEGADSAFSNGSDFRVMDQLVLPTGWVAPVVKDNCPCDSSSFPDCDVQYGCVDASACIGGSNPGAACTRASQCMGGGTCDQSGHYPANMAGQTSIRPDWLFYGFPTFHAIDVSTLNVRWGGTINGSDGQSSIRCAGGPVAGFSCTTSIHCPGSTCDANYQSYAGTLNLKLGSQACGTYTFTISDDPNKTFILNPELIPILAVPAIQPLVLTTGISCPVVPTGACCDTNGADTGCVDTVPQVGCDGPDKVWTENGECDLLDPACACIPDCTGRNCGPDGCGGLCPEISCDDDSVCTDDSCNPADGQCVNANNTLPCPDGTVCNGNEVCVDGACVPGTPLTCNDNNICNGDEQCDPVSGCTNPPDLNCTDGLACTGVESCNPSSGCVPGTPVVCDDGQACSIDTCIEPTGTCSFDDSDCTIPTVSEWGLVVLTLMLLIGAKVYFGRRQAIA